MALLALGAVTIVAMLAFIRSDQKQNKAATGLMWAVMAVWSFSGGL
jgi:hypothetical protein